MQGGPGFLVYPFPQYEGAGHVHVEYKLTGSAAAGVMIKMANEPSLVSAGKKNGYKVRITSEGDKSHCTGAIDGLSPASACLQKPIGEWNTLIYGWVG